MRKKRRVCIIRQYYFPQEAHIRRDAQALLNAGYDVDIICLRAPKESLFDRWNRARIYRIPIRHKRSGVISYIIEYLGFFLITFFLVSILQMWRWYYVIEVDTMPDFLVFTTLWPKITGAKILLYFFENMPHLMTRKYNLGDKHFFIRILRIIERICARYSDYIILTHDRKNILHKHINIILNVPDSSMFYDEKLSLKFENVSDVDSFNIITHSTLVEIYGIQYIIMAVNKISEKYNSIRLTVIGDGEYRPTLVALCNKLKLNDKIHFSGYIPFESVAKELLKADIGVVSIVSDYLLPNKLFEYIALGIPVVCADWDTIRPYFDNDQLTYYNAGDPEDLADKLLYVKNNYQESMTKARKAYMHFKTNYSWSVIKNKYLTIYELMDR